MGDLSYTVNNNSNLVSFKSAARVPITSLKAHFKPKQNLHGYSKPWIGGTGKNLLQNIRTVGDTEALGATFTTHADGSVSVVGNPTAESGLRINMNLSLPAGNYILSGCPAGGSEYTYCLMAGGNRDYGDGVTFTLEETTIVKVQILWVGNAPMDGLIFYPMIRLASNNDATWEPYENICPIEGWNSCEIYQTGKNLFNKNIIIPGYYISNGQIIANEHYGYLYIDIHNLSSVTISGCYNASLARFSFYTQDMIYISASQQKPRTLDVPNNAYYLSVSSIIDTSLSQYDLNTIQVEAGDTTTEYEPFQNQIPITFPTLGKNLLNLGIVEGRESITYQNNILTATAENIWEHIGKNQQDRIPIYIPANTTFTLSVTAYTDGEISTNKTGLAIFSGHEDGSGGVLITFPNSTTTATTQTYTGTDTKPITEIALGYYQYNNTWNISNVQIELGDTATTYEPYNSNNTVYGGYVDVVKGEVIATHALFETTWGSYDDDADGTADLGKVTRRFFTCPLTYKSGNNLTQSGLHWCNTTSDWEGNWGGNYVHYYAGNSSFILYLPYNTPDTTPIQFVAELASPINYKLPPSQLQTLLNSNCVWSNTNSTTEVSYAIHDTSPIRAAKARIIANEPHIETVSGSMAHFDTDMRAPLKSCKINFLPVQEGSGNPSPENIRPISGWSGIQYANLINEGSYTTRTNSQFNGATYIYDYTSYPSNIKVQGTSTQNNATPILVRTDATVVNQTYYIYNLPTLDYKAWLCGNGTNYSSTKASSNAITAKGLNGYPIISTGSGQIRIYFETITGNTYDLNLFPILSTIAPTEISWSSTAGTIYGGYVDLVKGELVETYHKLIFTDSSLFTYRNESSSYSEFRGPKMNTTEFPNLGNIGFMFNYLIRDRNTVWSGWIDASSSRLSLQFPTSINTETLLTNYLTEHPLELCYKIQPITHTLTPQQLKSLIGTNNIWSNSNDLTTVEYYTH